MAKRIVRARERKVSGNESFEAIAQPGQRQTGKGREK